MKNPLLLVACCLFAVTASSQALVSEKCKTEDVSLNNYTPDLPKSTIAVKYMTERLDRPVNQMSDLTEKEVRQIRKWARKFKSCTVYVDFEQVTIDKSLNPGITENDLQYLVVLQREE